MGRSFTSALAGLLLTAGIVMGSAAAAKDAVPLTALHSRDGLLAVTLVAAADRVHFGDVEVDGLTFNGSYAGPVLRVVPGDTLRVRLINNLTESTNLHFHGMRTSPLGNSDNIHVSVDPGDSFTYEIRIPKTQPPGMYWYHSHVHGLSEHQVSGGLSGALVVEDPAAPAMTERLFVLKDMAFDDDTDNATIDDEWHGIIQSVNGNLDTRLAIRPHEIQVWRFSNQSANLIFHIAVPGVTFRVIAEDAETLVNPVVTDVLNIHPGGRYEVLVEGGAPGEYPLLSKGAITGTGASRSHDRILGHLVVDGEPAVTAASAAPLPSAPDLRGLPVDERRTVVFSETKALKANDQLFFINNRTFNASRVDVRVPLGNNEEWTIRNDSDDMHVFHIHQLGFQVMAVNGVPVDYNGRVDTVRVPERGEVTLLIPFTDPVIIGQFMFHCHVLKHEDKGMMAQVEVYDPRINPHIAKIQAFYTRVWWWLHGVPWKLCGLGDA